MLDHFLSLFPHCELGSFFHPEYIDSGYLLWAQVLLQFCTDCYETLHVFSSWNEDVHVIWIIVRHFSSLFPYCELYVIFHPLYYRQWVSREHNTSYNFIPIFLKLCTCFLHSLKMCMFLIYRLWVPCDCNSSYNFTLVFLKLCVFFSPGSAEVQWFGCNF